MSNRKLEFSRGEIIASKYEVIDLLDESPLGLTYRVKHLKTGKYVRLALLRPKVASRDRKDDIIGAFKKAKDNAHPNLVKVGELGEHDGVAYYTLEDFEGSTLRELIQEYKIAGKQFEVKEAAQIVIQIVEGLSAAHKAGFVFRALRPEYILVHVRRTGPRRQNFVAQTKIMGLGFWDLVDAAALAEDEFTRGEAQYLAPELKSFEPFPTPRCDIYSAGVIFYEMLTGTAPVGTFQLPKTRRPDLPDHVNNVVELALANAPEDRYQDSQDFITDIQRTFQDAGLETVERRPLIGPLGWVAGLITVALIAIILFNLRGDKAVESAALDSQIRKEVSDDHPKPPPGEVQAIIEKHPPNMIYIPPGPFVAGRLNSELDDVAPRSEALAERRELHAFLIDAFEYPNLKNGAPKFKMPYAEAAKMCAEQQKRLCTADEWEKACKGPQNYVYSYGDTFDEDYCGRGVEDVYRSGERPDCKSGWGVFDMSGNFREWTATPGDKDGRSIVKGGIRAKPQKGTRCGFGVSERQTYVDANMGFRCCRDVNAPPYKGKAKGKAKGKGAKAKGKDAKGKGKGKKSL